MILQNLHHLKTMMNVSKSHHISKQINSLPEQLTIGTTREKKTSEHDTVAVLYQNDSGLRTTKPKLSEARIIRGPRCFNEILSCQTLCDFY